MLGIDEIHQYWRSPWDGVNSPEDYARSGWESSHFILELIRKYALSTDSILEIGCNSGRNLKCLWGAGFYNLTGIEINTKAIKVMREFFPELGIKVLNTPVEGEIQSLDSFDMVFTKAVLCHIHYDSDWIFPEMARMAQTLLVIEDEKGNHWRKFPRNYEKVFTPLGLKQIEETKLPSNNGYTVRVFRNSLATIPLE